MTDPAVPERPPVGSINGVIQAVVDVVGTAISRSNISMGECIGVVRGATGSRSITLHIAQISPWRKGFSEEYLAGLTSLEELDIRHGFIQSTFGSHIVQGSTHNIAMHIVPHDEETTKDYRCLLGPKNILKDDILASILVLAKLHYPITMVFQQAGEVTIHTHGNQNKVPRLSQEVFLFKAEDVTINTPSGGYPAFLSGNNGLVSIYAGRPDRLFKAITSSVAYHKSVIDQMENLRLDIRVCRAAVDGGMSLSDVMDVLVNENVITEPRGTREFVANAMDKAKDIRGGIQAQLSEPLAEALKNIPDFLLTGRMFYHVLSKVMTLIQPITTKSNQRNGIVHEMFVRDNLVDIPSFLLWGNTKFLSKESAMATFIRDIVAQAVDISQSEIDKMDKDTMSIRDLAAVESIENGINSFVSFFVPTFPSHLQTMISTAWDYRNLDNAGQATLSSVISENPDYLLRLGTSYSRIKVQDVSGWSPADIRKAQLPSALVAKPNSVIDDDTTASLFKIIKDNYPHHVITAVWDSYRARKTEVQIIRERIDFENAKNVIYSEFDAISDKSIRDKRWVVTTQRIWATPINDLFPSENIADNSDLNNMVSQPDVIIRPAEKLGDNRLKWYPTAVAFAQYLQETWAGLLGSQTTIEPDLLSVFARS